MALSRCSDKQIMCEKLMVKVDTVITLFKRKYFVFQYLLASLEVYSRPYFLPQNLAT